MFGCRQRHRFGKRERHSFDTPPAWVRVLSPLPTLAVKAQHHRRYAPIPSLLRQMREEAGLTQRELGARLDKPQSWAHNCETGNRRIDLGEFVAWCEACNIRPQVGLSKYLRA